MEQLAEKVFLKDEHDKLAEFFQKTWEEPSTTEKYEYRVYLGQMCANLNELFFIRIINQANEEEKARLLGVRDATFFTSVGLLAQMKELVDYYERNGRFPRVLVVDLLLTTGKPFAEATATWFHAIAEELNVPEESVEARSRYALLLKATDYVTFMRSRDDELLVTMNYEERMSPCKNSVSASEYFGTWMNCNASIVFSDAIQHDDFLPTFWMSRDEYNEMSKRLRDEGCRAGWRRESWRLYNKSAVVWQKGLPGAYRGICAQQVVRCSFCSDIKKYAVTPFVLWHSTDDKTSERVYAEFVSAMNKAGVCKLGPLTKSLRSQQHYMADTKLRLLMVISAVLTFCHFVEDASNGEYSDLVEYESDIEKVSRYFGRSNILAPAFRALLSREAAPLRKELWGILAKFVKTHAKPLCENNQSDLKHGKDFYLNQASNHQITLNTKHQKEIQYRRNHQICFVHYSRYYQPEGFFEDYLADFPPDYTSLDSKIGSLIILMMWDVVELTVHRKLNDGKDDGRSAIYLRDV